MNAQPWTRVDGNAPPRQRRTMADAEMRIAMRRAIRGLVYFGVATAMLGLGGAANAKTSHHSRSADVTFTKNWFQKSWKGPLRAR